MKILTPISLSFFFLIALLSAKSSAQTIEALSFCKDQYTEYSPSISANGKRLVFQSNENGYRTWQLFECEWQPKSGRWSSPKPIGSINEFGKVPALENQFQGDYIACPTLNATGDTLYFCANFEGGMGKRDIYYAFIQENGTWSKPINMFIPINSSENEDFPSISADGNTFYFTRYPENPISKDTAIGICYAIYASYKDIAGQWQKPVRLPSSINKGCEKAPRIQADDATLLFSSVRTGGKGNYDLYASVVDIRGRWSEPRALDFINTPDFDQFGLIPVDESRIYYCSEGEKTPDIFTFSPVPDWLKLQKSGIVKVKVIKEDGTQIIQAGINMRLNESDNYLIKTLETNWDGEAFFKLRSGYGYKMEVKALGFLMETVVFDFLTQIGNDTVTKVIRMMPDNSLIASNQKNVGDNSQDIAKNTNTKNLSMKISTQNKNNPYQKRLDAGENLIYFDSLIAVNQADKNELILEKYLQKGDITLIFNHINFAFASTTLDKQYLKDLDAIILLMQRQKNLHLLISAHTDDIGTDESNLLLSQQRSASVKEYLVSKEIEEKRLKDNFFGESQPLYPNTDETNRSKNRRVEIKIIHDGN